jgi:hypothetical protein
MCVYECMYMYIVCVFIRVHSNDPESWSMCVNATCCSKCVYIHVYVYMYLVAYTSIF